MTERPDIVWLEASDRRMVKVIGGDRVINKVIALCQYTLELEDQLKAMAEELGKVRLAYEMSEALRTDPRGSPQ